MKKYLRIFSWLFFLGATPAVNAQICNCNLTLTSQTNVTCNGGSNGSATVSGTAIGGGCTNPGTDTDDSHYTWNTTPVQTGRTATGLSAGTYICTWDDWADCYRTRTVTITEPNPITGNAQSTNETCNQNNGTVDVVNVNGGTSPYSYLWNTGHTTSGVGNRNSGSYTCTVTDAAGCTKVFVCTVNNTGTPVTANASVVNNVSCFGGNNGSATVSVSGGGGAPYTYSWAPSGGNAATANNLTAGGYTVTVTGSNGCVNTDNVTVTQPSSAINIGSTSMIPVSCNGGSNGSASVSSITGGTGAYTYSWAPSGGNAATANNLSANVYTCTVRDANNCSAAATVTVTQFPAVSASISSTQNVSCWGGSNGSVTVSASGGNGTLTYLWSSGAATATATGLTAGTYNVTVWDANGCSTTVNNVPISQPNALAVSTSSTPANCGTATGSATATVSGGTGTYTYQWSPSGGNAATANNLAAGSYNVTVWDANGCNASDAVIVGSSGGISANAVMTASVTCSGGANGSASVTASSGTPPYTYSWSPSGATTSSATGLGAGVHTVNVTDNAACVSTKTVNITQPAAITVSVSANPAACASSNGSANASSSGGTGGYTYSWTTTPVQSTATATGLAAGSYSVTVRDANNCSKTSSVTVGTVPSPAVAFSTVSVTCHGGNNGSATATPTGGGGPPFTYLWSPGGQTTQTATGLSAGTYSVQVSTASCSNTATVVVAQPTSITANVSTTPTPCLQSVGSATVSPGGGTPPFTYAWNPGGQTTSVISGLAAGFYTITVTDSKGCTRVSSAIVNSINGPTVTPTSSSVTCFGGNDGSAFVTASGGTQPYTYAWSPGGATTSAISNVTAQVFSATVFDNAGCVTTVTLSVTEPGPVLPNVTSASVTVCKGTQAQLGANPTGGTAPYSYNWTPGADLDDGTLQNPVAGPTATTTYSVVVTDKNGCTGTGTVTVVVDNPPVINAGPAGITICNGGSATLSASGGNTYLWSPASGLNNSTIANPIATPSAAITYTVTGTGANGCTNTDTIRINLIATPTVTIASSASTVCSGTGVTLTASTNAASYLWSTGQTTSSATVVPSATTTYSVTVSTGNCSAVKTVTITALPTPSAVVTGNTIHCTGSSQVISATAGNYSYSWNTGATTSSITISPTVNTIYSVTVTSGMCSSATTFSVTASQPPAVTTSATYTTLCVGSSQNTLTASGGASYSWLPGGATTSSIAVSFTSTGIKTYTVVVTSAAGCSAVSTVTMNVTSGYPSPLVNNTNAVSLSLCYGDPAPTFTATPNPPTLAIGWTDPLNSFSASGTTFTPPPNVPAGTYTYYCVQGTGTSCMSLPTNIILTVNPLPTITAGGGTTICPGFSTPLSAGGGVSYLWSPPEGLSSPVVSNPTAEPQLTTVYEVTGTGANGCRNSDSVTVYVVLNDTCTVIIYNLISPNADGNNDVWWIDGIKFFPDNRVQIFNRWGAKVWEGTGYDNETVVWRGDNQNGKKLPAAAYYYIIDLGDKTLSGFVELVH